MSAPEKIHDPESGVYLGLIWEVGGEYRAEDRAATTRRAPFATFDEAFDWIRSRCPVRYLESAA